MNSKLFYLVNGVLLLFLLVGTAHAKKKVYSPNVEKDEKEVEYYIDWLERSDNTTVINHEGEFSYGFSGKDKVAFYVVYEDTNKNDIEFNKYRVEWIHHLFNQGKQSWNIGTYLEYQFNDAVTNKADKIEFKPLFTKTLDGTTLTINGIFEKEIGSNASNDIEMGYAMRYAWHVNKSMMPAIEMFGDFGDISDIKPTDQQSHIIGPVMKMKFSKHVGLHVGAFFGLTDNSEDIRVKSGIAYEW